MASTGFFQSIENHKTSVFVQSSSFLRIVMALWVMNDASGPRSIYPEIALDLRLATLDSFLA